ncbi:hypothetical protein, partial [Nocardia sp. NPDC024068]|uniref:hypothetical protein n=1 Tax=Nocardia sp. NPDC024068 TaxID=3157197 RepID=UPI0033D319DA
MPPSVAPVMESAPDTTEPHATVAQHPHNTSKIRVLRRPVESSLRSPIGVVDHVFDVPAGSFAGPDGVFDRVQH